MNFAIFVIVFEIFYQNQIYQNYFLKFFVKISDFENRFNVIIGLQQVLLHGRSRILWFQSRNEELETLASLSQELTESHDPDADHVAEKLRLLNDDWLEMKRRIDIRITISILYVSFLKITQQVNAFRHRIRIPFVVFNNLKNFLKFFPENYSKILKHNGSFFRNQVSCEKFQKMSKFEILYIPI